MEEKVKEAEVCQPQQTEEILPPEGSATTPSEGSADSAFVEVRFNKETKRLTLDEAATLAQKGMKFDMIADSFEKLKALSKGRGLGVGDFLTRLEQEEREKKREEFLAQSGGNVELADRLLTLEAPKGDDLSELKAEFPDLGEDDIPDEVKTAASIKGTGLLFEYLLYHHRQRLAAEEELASRRSAADKSLGPLSSGTAADPARAEFIKGVWGR